jgi:hypothetical protein
MKTERPSFEQTYLGNTSYSGDKEPREKNEDTGKNCGFFGCCTALLSVKLLTH